MLTKPQQLIIEQATAKAGGKLSFEQKKSTKTTAVYFVRASNRPDARRNIQNFLKSKKLVITEKKTSLSRMLYYVLYWNTFFILLLFLESKW